MFSKFFKTKKGKLTFWIALSAVVLIIATSFYFVYARADVFLPYVNRPAGIDLPDPAGVTGYFGDLTVLVKDKKSSKPISGAMVSFSGSLSNKALARLGVTCSNHSLTTGDDGKALFTKANGPKNIKTWAEGYVRIGPFRIKQQGYCIYTMTTTPAGGANVTQTISWPKKPAQDTNLGTTIVLVDATTGLADVQLTHDAGGTVPVNTTLNLTWTVNPPDIGTTCTANSTPTGLWSGAKTWDKTTGVGTEAIKLTAVGTDTFWLTCMQNGQTYSPLTALKGVTVGSAPPAAMAALHGTITHNGLPYTVSGQVVKVINLNTGLVYMTVSPITGGVYGLQVPTGTYPATIYLNVNNVNVKAWTPTLTVPAAGLIYNLSF